MLLDSRYVLVALSLPHAIPLKAPWIVSTSDSEYLWSLPSLEVLTIKVLLYIDTYILVYGETSLILHSMGLENACMSD